MSGYASLAQDDPGLMSSLWRWMCAPQTEDPYSKALTELTVCYGKLISDVQAQDATLVRLYNSFHAHMCSQRPPEVAKFNDVVRWYKRNRDATHTAIVKLLETRALAHENPSKFMEVWELMPEDIRRSRRKWRQPYSEAPAVERNVDDAFEMPPQRAPDVPLDYETEFDAD